MEWALLALLAGGLYYYSTKDEEKKGETAPPAGWQPMRNTKPLTYEQLDDIAGNVDALGGDKNKAGVAVHFALSHETKEGPVSVMAIGEAREYKLADGKTKRIWNVAFLMFDPKSLENVEMKMLTSKEKLPAAPAKGTLYTLTDDQFFA